MKTRQFGHISEVPVGKTFASRRELSVARIHPPNMSGISGSGIEGADSIVLSGGYEDDRDFGSVIIYTGQGGRDPETRKQVSDQTLTKGNLALAVSELHGLPVRVTRGAGHKSNYSPEIGYRYDGLFRVESHWRDKGKSGFDVWRYRLVELDGSANGARKPDDDLPGKPPLRKALTILRIVRDSKQSRQVKKIHDYRCQVCGLRLETAAGAYAEGAHIRPLGEPHNGSDTLNNILCLCPNHHVLLDQGAFSMEDNFELIGLVGTLRTHASHPISRHNIGYHRDHYLNTTKKLKGLRRITLRKILIA
jgi:putative restriction endonuclease